MDRPLWIFPHPITAILASFVKVTWVLNVQHRFYEPTPSLHPWIGSRPDFVVLRCFLPHGGAASTKTSTRTPHFYSFSVFSNPFSIILASFVKVTWVLNVQHKFYEPTPSVHHWIGSRPDFVVLRCFLPHGGAASTKTSTRTPHFYSFSVFSNPFSIILASFVKVTWVLNVQHKFYEPCPLSHP